MPLPREIQEELERKRHEEHKQAERDAFRANVRAALMCVVWSAAGLGVMAFGLHTSDPEIGAIAWKGGMVVGYAGIVFTLMRWHSKARDRGDV
jgi:hypothetical protein